MTQSRADRLHRVIHTLGRAVGHPLTFTELSRGAGLKRSPYMKEKILEQLERDGYIEKTLNESTYPKRYEYKLTETGWTLYDEVERMGLA